ncbi:MAG: hypothetical protein JSR46_02615 [Verrucomicrobia bacterium]|nr:hypothetical protein [Verrucomicrobiota bacterium]
MTTTSTAATPVSVGLSTPTKSPTFSVPETPLINQGNKRDYPSLHDVFSCDWCNVPLVEEENAPPVRRQCFVCGTCSCENCASQGHGQSLTYIDSRFICDKCTRDLVRYVEVHSNTPLKRMKACKRKIRHLSARGHVFSVQRLTLD